MSAQGSTNQSELGGMRIGNVALYEAGLGLFVAAVPDTAADEDQDSFIDTV